ncbi:hypothetical protein EJ05DRAFT_518928 [Pseudovirgaria hyperparasitica]|uniref:ABC transporter domain-containing protein n=1 Tax=Pseudovirgaria hyperparasitica TaxID=470096 RepID=A0A6A6VZY2_9PEZI|nr:uncharacterized protein EJ05DRAFT_518928 [Pseudovirgaria hyperparasitica]KAF2756238.1 hypothetical protein EJ05DRAFT_518928 [Pseudovirgaria hyperparasitica]
MGPSSLLQESSAHWLHTIEFSEQKTPSSQKLTPLVFRNLSVHGHAVTADFQHTCGNYPSVLLGRVQHRHAKDVCILRCFDGIVRESQMHLILGRPGSGCTTLLKTLTGEMDGLMRDADSKLEYGEINSNRLRKTYRDRAVYHAEQTVHFPELTVRETLEFTAAAVTPASPQAGVSRNDHIRSYADATIRLFSLEKVADSKIGDDLVRGISGGERQRLSVAEAMMKCCQIQAWDNSTRGLDHATALFFVKLQRAMCTVLQSVSIMSLYQASEAMYQEFDSVSLLYDGLQVYFGPTNRAKSFFEDLGFICKPDMTTPDFLTSLTNPAERMIAKEAHNRVPRTAADFERVWKSSKEYGMLLQEIDGHFVSDSGTTESKPCSNPVIKRATTIACSKLTLLRSTYMIPFARQLGLCLIRASQRLKHSYVATLSGISGLAILGLIIGSVFYDLQPNTGNFFSRGAIIFFATILNANASAFEVLTMWAQRPIVEKQSRYSLYHPSAEALASMLADLPSKIIASLAFNLSIYLLTNLRRAPAAFFTFYLFGFTCHLTMSMFFRMVGSLSRTFAQSMVPVSVWILNLIITSGFVLPSQDMPPWIRWISYLNPMAYAFESVMVNEFSGRYFSCSGFIPSGQSYNQANAPQTCDSVGSVPGGTEVNGSRYIESQFSFKIENLWRNYGILVAFMICFCIIHLLAAEFISAQRPRGDVLIFQKKSSSRRGAISQVDEEIGRITGSEESPNAGLDSPSTIVQTEEIPSALHKGSILTWDDVGYRIGTKLSSKQILSGIDGWVKPGTLTALMGATGAGKTTLLDVLAARTRVGVVTGNISVNGKVRDAAFQRQTGFVQQTDVHVETCTVREALMFSATLRQPRSKTRLEKAQHVDSIINTLGMDAYADAVVGTPGAGLNIEQRRKLSIAVELAAEPDVLLFLDEPTSGLDSQTAWLICCLLQKLARAGQAILCTVHQPSALVFDVFDHVLILGPRGRQLYFGATGPSSCHLVDYFESNGARKRIKGENTAEWLLEISCSAPTSSTQKDWAEVWEDSEEHRQIKASLGYLTRSKSTQESIPPTAPTQKEYATPLLEQILWVTYRNLQQEWRIPSYLYPKVLLSVGTAFFIGVSFWRPDSSIQGIQNQIFAIFCLMILFGSLCQLIIDRFAQRRAAFEAREHLSKTFSSSAFLVASILGEIPSQTVIALLIYVSWYYPIGFYRHAGASIHARGGLIFLFIWCYCVFMSTLSLLVIAGIGDTSVAVNIAQLIYSLSQVFSGVLIRPSALPSFWKFMNRVTPLTYLIGGISTVAMWGADVRCRPSELVEVPLPARNTCGEYLQAYIATAGGYVVDPSATASCFYCSVASSDAVLYALGFKYDERWRNVGLMLAYIVFNVAGIAFLFWLKVRRS